MALREPTVSELAEHAADPHLAFASSEVALVGCFCVCRYEAACHCDNFGVCDCVPCTRRSELFGYACREVDGFRRENWCGACLAD